ncbi:hypothetical protein A9235_01950 [Polynucleobacter sp. MWH-Tro8-2-5-gr]|uniref:class I SAM-dependent methyltransferase n=1 Tax=Polynucleobacter sp. MWH-Tro8-2-5-gr TaxID=1855606 RepID=UPI0008F8E25B|nr:class I SAM-dependent methyltransferase [Polynucleobacter sp. MWH-Tro8-2-5-gr]OIN02473.1 hypothetical protein A9235_01950 [Polynucleobacter sp. MWH-Tro8-2-5-gr]
MSSIENKKIQERYFDSYTDEDYFGKNLTPIFNKNILSNYLERFNKNTKILDFGCGNGKYGFTEHLINLGFNVSFTDISANSVNALKKRLKYLGLKFDISEFGDISLVSQKIDKNYFDVIFFGDVFHHLTYEDTKTILLSLKKIIKNSDDIKGKIIGIEPNGKCPIWRLMPIYNKEFKWEIEKNIKYCTRADFEKKFSDSGFKLIEYKYIRFLPISLVTNFNIFKKIDNIITSFPIIKNYSQYTLLVAEPI